MVAGSLDGLDTVSDMTERGEFADATVALPHIIPVSGSLERRPTPSGPGIVIA